jgi:hypothetical protein
LTNVPTATFGPNGFIEPIESAILAGVQSDINTAFGSNLNPALTTPQGQLASSEAAIIGNANDTFLFYTTQTDPAFAIGRMQDAIGRIYFIERNSAQPTLLQIVCNGLTGVNIPAGALIQDTSGNTYSCTGAGTITSAGSVTLPFANNTYGPIAVPNTNSVSIYQAIPGWDSATCASGELGNNTESRAAFELRRQQTVAGNSLGAIGSIIGAVANVPNVLDYYGYDNSTGSPITVGGVTVTTSTIYICVAGGLSTAIAQAILSKKGPGAGYTGNTTVVAYDSNPLYSAPIPYNVTFEIPAALQALFVVNIVNSAQVPANATALIQAAIINAFAGGDGGSRARIGSTIYASRFYAPVASLGSWAQIISIVLGSANSPGAVFMGSIAGTTLSVSAVASGTIAIGQTLTDVNGLILPGTTITAGSGSSWTVSNSQIVGSETINSVLPALNSIAVQVNQVPAIAAQNIVVNLV